MIAPGSVCRSGGSRRNKISTTGMTNASVLPEPVTACVGGGGHTAPNMKQSTCTPHLGRDIHVLHKQRNRGRLHGRHLLKPECRDGCESRRMQRRLQLRKLHRWLVRKTLRESRAGHVPLSQAMPLAAQHTLSQSDSHVFVTVAVKGVKPSDVDIYCACPRVHLLRDVRCARSIARLRSHMLPL